MDLDSKYYFGDNWNLVLRIDKIKQTIRFSRSHLGNTWLRIAQNPLRSDSPSPIRR